MCEDLLTKELWARSPYHVKVFYENDFYDILGISCGRVVLVKPVMSTVAATPLIKEVKLYLRPMSSMTNEEIEDYHKTMDKYTHRIYPNSADFSEHTEYSWTAETIDWLNKHHFDYRGLIENGLALKAPEGMYK